MTRRGHFIAISLIALCSLFLTGCKTAGKVYTVLTNPDIPVGAQSGQPTELALTLFADPNINPNQNGESSPVQLQVIYLNEDSQFLSLDYDQFLSEGPEKTLGKNYIDHQDYTIMPGQFKPQSTIKLDPQTRFIGVVAHYAWIDGSQWAALTDVNAIGEKMPLLIHIAANEVSIIKQNAQENN